MEDAPRSTVQSRVQSRTVSEEHGPPLWRGGTDDPGVRGLWAETEFDVNLMSVQTPDCRAVLSAGSI